MPTSLFPRIVHHCPIVFALPHPIRQDTKLSRMTQTPAPLEAVREFLAKNTGKDGQQHWVADRDRELLYSQHVMGYLKRLA